MADCSKCQRTDVKCCYTCQKDTDKCGVWHNCGSDCPEHEGGIKTNADRIRSMTDEELADFLYCIEAYCEDGEYKKYIEEVTLSDNMHDILQWLQSEAE